MGNVLPDPDPGPLWDVAVPFFLLGGLVAAAAWLAWISLRS